MFTQSLLHSLLCMHTYFHYSLVTSLAEDKENQHIFPSVSDTQLEYFFFAGHTWFGSRSSIYQIGLDEKSSDCASTNYRQKQTISKGKSHLNNQIYKFANHFLLVQKLSKVTTWKLNWLLNWITVNDFHFLSVLLLSSYCFDYVYIRSFKYQLVYKYFLIWICTGGVLWERQHSWQWNLGRYGFERILRASWYIN